MSIGEVYKGNNKKEKGNLYCDHNMAGDYNSGSVLLSWYGLQCSNVLQMQSCPEPVYMFIKGHRAQHQERSCKGA